MDGEALGLYSFISLNVDVKCSTFMAEGDANFERAPCSKGWRVLPQNPASSYGKGWNIMKRGWGTPIHQYGISQQIWQTAIPPPKKKMYYASSSYCREINGNNPVALFWRNKTFIHVHKDNKATKCINEHYKSRGAVRLVGSRKCVQALYL